MSAFINIAGKRFGRLVAESFTSQSGGKVGLWHCRCDCGNYHSAMSRDIRVGAVKSCGCLRREVTGARSRTHGRSGTTEYTIWIDICKRCTNPKHKFYHHYGGRGIKVCARWSKFENFLKDMGPRPSSRHSVERQCNNSGYAPDNCCWATQKQQCNNKRTNVVVTFSGKTQTATQWGSQLSLPVMDRLWRGWSVLDALTKPLRQWPGPVHPKNQPLKE